MATNAPGQGPGGPAAYGGGPSRTGGAAPAAGLISLIGVAALVAIAIALFLMASNQSTNNCIAKAEAEFPTVPVSAFATSRNATGPLKVSFSKERADAVRAC